MRFADLVLFTAIALLPDVTSELTDPESVQLGDEVCFEGFVMDNFCIELGNLLDNSNVVTLEGPDQHSVHCLVDVQSCRESNYEILADPTTAGGLYTRALQVDDSGKQLLVDIARDVGSCSTCTGNGDLRQGFRAEVRGMVIALADGEIPPTISVTGAIFSDGTATACDGSEPLTPSTGGSSGAGGGDSSNVDKLGNESDENDTAINVVSSISVVCILLVALISMFKGTFQRK